MKPQDAWQNAYIQLEIQFDRANFDTWIKDTTYLDFDANERVFVLGVQNSYARDMLQHRLYRNVRRVLSDAYGEEIEIEFELIRQVTQVESVPVRRPRQQQDMPLFEYMSQQPAEPRDLPLHQQVRRPQLNDLPESEINPRLTFDRYVVNRANQMVFEAARAVAESPNGVYNPLMIYGGVGLGKTHLLQAIANDCAGRNLRVIYVPSEAFTNDLVAAIRKRQQAMFREKYRSADILIVDDVQFIAGKESTQEEFFHTFNALYTFNKQIVLASDRHPDQLTTLEDRLRSRFAGGLIVDVQPPEFETRVAILDMWAQERHIDLDLGVLEMIADRAPDNIREMEGVFNHIIAKARFAPDQFSFPQAERTLSRFEQPRNHVHPVTVQRVLEVTASAFDMDVATLASKRRTRRVNLARQTAVYLARELTDASLPQIGDAVGGRTHSTIIHACNKMQEEIDTDRTVAEQVERIRRMLFGEDA
ncbi:MAG: chromosomal replication initiator protein DnaA [Chloroflexota bacterium]